MSAQFDAIPDHSGPTMNLQFSYESAELLNVSGIEAEPWLRACRRFSPWLVLVWVMLTRKAAPSDKGLFVYGKKGCYRLGDMVMLYKPEWKSVTVIWLLSERQKAWLHGVSFLLQGVAKIDRKNMEQLGKGVE